MNCDREIHCLNQIAVSLSRIEELLNRLEADRSTSPTLIILFIITILLLTPWEKVVDTFVILKDALRRRRERRRAWEEIPLVPQ